jgi:hypothetical protein
MTSQLIDNRENLGAKKDLIFSGAQLSFLFVAYFYYPEIKGQGAAKLDRMFTEHVPARDFKRWHCTIEFDREIITISLMSSPCVYSYPRKYRDRFYGWRLED